MKLVIVTIISSLLIQTCFANSNVAVKKQSIDAMNDEDAQFIMKMKKRKNYLKFHKYSAWTSVALMAGALATGSDGEDSLHQTLGMASGLAYLASAGSVYLAPKFEDQKLKTNIYIHEKLAYIHFPAFLLAGYTGYLAAKDRDDDKELSGFAKKHKTFAGIAAVSFGLAAFMSTDWSMAILPEKNKGISWHVSKSF